MGKYISLDALLAEIDKRINTCLNQREEMIIEDCETLVGDATARAGELQCLKDSIESLEVKEMGFEKIWKEYFKYRGDVATVNVKHLAKHFFELGLKAQKGE